MKRLTVELPRDLAEPVSDLLLGLGAEAVSVETEKREAATVHAYFAEETDTADVAAAAREFFALLGGNAEEPRFAVRRVIPQDWEGWKSRLRSVKASRRTVIRPPWEKGLRAEPGTVEVEINPGCAFGTGHHETTRICVSYLDEIIGKSPGCSVFDVGCGSGVLGICSVMLGAAVSFCADIDFAAAKETVSNSRRNMISDRIKVWCGSAGSTRKKFDVVVCNTSCAALLSMKDVLRSRLLPSGRLVAAGMLADEKRKTAAAYAESGYDIVGERTEGGWSGLLFALKKDGRRER